MSVTWDVTILSCEHDIVMRHSQRATTLEAVLKNRECNLVAAGWPSLAEIHGLRFVPAKCLLDLVLEARYSGGELAATYWVWEARV
jgi:hypothetical protein